MQRQPEDLDEGRRHEIYLALMTAQEVHDFGVGQARQLIATRLGVTPAQIHAIEQEGRERLW